MIPPKTSIEEELCRVATVASGGAYAIRVENLRGRTTLLVGWIKGLEYKHFEVVLEADGKVNPGALRKALEEVQ